MTSDETKSIIGTVAVFGAGVLTMLGVNALSSADLQTDVQHMVNGVQEFWLGAGPIVALAVGWYKKYKSSIPAQAASVDALPTVHVETTDRKLADAAGVKLVPKLPS